MRDSFDARPSVPTSIGPVAISFVVTPGSPNTYSASYAFEVLDQDGDVLDVRKGNLVPHLTAQQVTQVKTFLDAMATKASGVLP